MLRQAAYTPLGRACGVPGAVTLAAAPRGGTRSDGIPAVNDRQQMARAPQQGDSMLVLQATPLQQITSYDTSVSRLPQTTL